MKTSQKHLNSIKSVFGGIKNWWGGKKEQPQQQNTEQTQQSSRLRDQVDSHRESEPHPAMRLRGTDYSGFYDDSPGASGQSAMPAQRQTFAEKSTYDQQFDDNLGKIVRLPFCYLSY